MSNRFRLTSSVLLLVLCSVSWADIGYGVAVQPEAGKLAVSIEVPVQRGSSHVVVQMPKWGPGSYRYQDFAGKVADVKAKDAKGNERAVEKTDETTWRVAVPSSGSVIVSYTLPAAIEDDVTHWGGPATYMYVVGRKEEPCKLSINVPAGWKIAVGLNPVGGRANVFSAPDYDVLADNPVTVGKYLEDTYTSLGKPHFIALRGANRDEVDRALLKRYCQLITESQAHFFGGLPYDRYVWHFVTMDSRDGAWGLEHLSSTQMGIATGLGPGVVGVLAHEFFHLWNVKRIRSKALGPFNYQELPQTGALWFLEGTTDYFAHMLLRRYGLTEDERWHSVVASNIRAVRRNERRTETSPYDSSFRVRDANGGRGNSQGFNVNYYDTGFVLGMMLDIELRSRTNGVRSLDDVVRALYAMNKDGKPGFEEGEIRRQLIRFGGDEMGPIYDKWVLAPGELPVEEQLAKAGLALVEKEVAFPDMGFTYAYSRDKGGFEVRSVSEGSDVPVQRGDVIVSLNGKALGGLSNRSAQEIAAGAVTNPEEPEAVQVAVKRGEETLEVSITPKKATRKVQSVEFVQDASPEAKRLREAWLRAPAGWPKKV